MIIHVEALYSRYPYIDTNITKIVLHCLNEKKESKWKHGLIKLTKGIGILSIKNLFILIKQWHVNPDFIRIQFTD